MSDKEGFFDPMGTARELCKWLGSCSENISCKSCFHIGAALAQAFQGGRKFESGEILRKIEFCGFGSMEWRMKLIGKLKEK